MKIYSTRIRELRLTRKISQDDLAKVLGISRSAVGMYETGKREPDLETCEAIADYFNIDMDYLTGRSDVERRTIVTPPLPGMMPYNPSHRIPILGRVAAGVPLLAEENVEGYVLVDFGDDGETYYALRVHGDSMSAVGINDNDLVVVRQQSTVDDGQIAVVLVNGYDATIKYFKQEGNLVFLTPKSYNPEHQIQIYNLNDTPVRIIGRVVSSQRYY